jgi:hypothetical protein
VPVDWEVLKPSGVVAPIYLLALPFALFALFRWPGRFEAASMLLAALCVFSAIAYGSPRLRLPYEPLLFVAGASAVRGAGLGMALPWALICTALYVAGPAGKSVFRALGVYSGLW